MTGSGLSASNKGGNPPSRSGQGNSGEPTAAQPAAPAARSPSPHVNPRDDAWIAPVLRQFEGPLTLYTARITRDLERARDVVQEAFLKLLLEDRAAIEPHLAEWLYTVCRNKALDVRRKESRVSSLNEAAVSFEPAVDPGPDAVLERRESSAKALRFLNRLPENQQECIRLKFQNGLSYKEISNVTNLSVSNVGFLIHTGLKTLRQRMASERP